MPVEFSVFLIAVAFVGLVISIIMLLRKMMVSLDEANKTLAEARATLRELSSEAGDVLQHANEIALEVKDKMRAMDSIVNSAHDVGQILHTVTDTARKAVSVLNHGSQAASPEYVPTNKITIKKSRDR
ncbi:DUF948 domain-containing protein [Paenibacillus sp. P96]|uniref:DUF948 domain-containing protein n=1 Tax=Paenibacillus zeirhizosphaerae TaxID=2987519 RepID=A0ABT9FN62_9BACL|nr:DUF948 domain-containing protein [Paenibacillus sp. P96]MDP4096181.1 DUF948 domain-containing protein [Paenibacillus sp. P96]